MFWTVPIWNEGTPNSRDLRTCAPLWVCVTPHPGGCGADLANDLPLHPLAILAYHQYWRACGVFFRLEVDVFFFLKHEATVPFVCFMLIEHSLGVFLEMNEMMNMVTLQRGFCFADSVRTRTVKHPKTWHQAVIYIWIRTPKQDRSL